MPATIALNEEQLISAVSELMLANGPVAVLEAVQRSAYLEGQRLFEGFNNPKQAGYWIEVANTVGLAVDHVKHL